MINRQNWLDTRAFLYHLERQGGKHPETIRKYRMQLRHLLEWADEISLSKAREIDPVFPIYLLSARVDGKSMPLTYTTIYKTLATVRTFFQFARLEWHHRYRRLSDSWITLLQPMRIAKSVQLQEHRFYTIEEVKAIASVSTETLHEARGQVAACMLFLSGMRPDALASLPIACVDLTQRRILQIPQMGIRTKNNKAAITYLLDIPELMDVVIAWDRRVRSFSPNSLWYATMNNDASQLTETMRAIIGRASVIGDDIRLVCEKAGVEYLSPHKFRHGHIVHARNLAQNMEQLKAISQNVMHSSVLITDQVYSALTDNQVRDVISTLGHGSRPSHADLIVQLTELLAQLKQSDS